jgi:hypothetical protein
MLTLPDHLSSPLVFSWVRVTRSSVLCVYFVDRCLSFCTFSLAIVLSLLLRYTDSDYLPLVSSNSSYFLQFDHYIIVNLYAIVPHLISNHIIIGVAALRQKHICVHNLWAKQKNEIRRPQTLKCLIWEYTSLN